MPALGSWTLPSMKTTQNIDSLVFAAQLAGFTGITSDAEADSNTHASGTPMALGSGQRSVNVRYGNNAGAPFQFLTFPGRSFMIRNSASAGHASNNEAHGVAYAYRALLGLVLPMWMWQEKSSILTGENGTYGENGQLEAGTPGVFGSISKKANINTGVNVLRFTCADLGSGNNQIGTTSPDRPGYWAMVHVKNSFDAINALAGRSLFQIVWDHEIGPRDLRR
jgi:hypothetical protein